MTQQASAATASDNFNRANGNLTGTWTSISDGGLKITSQTVAGSVKLPGIEDAVKAGGFLAGTPADIIEQLKAVERRWPGLDRVICATPLGTPLDVQLEDLDRFAKEVMPAFGAGVGTTRAAAAQ